MMGTQIIDQLPGQAAPFLIDYKVKNETLSNAKISIAGKDDFKEFRAYMTHTTARFVREYGKTLPGAADVGDQINKIFKVCEKYVSADDKKDYMEFYGRCMFTVGKAIAHLQSDVYPSSYRAFMAEKENYGPLSVKHNAPEDLPVKSKRNYRKFKHQHSISEPLGRLPARSA